MPYYIFVFVTLLCGLLLLFKVTPPKRGERLRVGSMVRQGKRDLIVRKQPLLLERMRLRLLHMLQLARIAPTVFVALCVCSGCGGLFLGGAVFADFFLAVLMALAAIPLPLVIVLVRSREFARRESEQLEGLMSSVTNAYMATNSIISAFESYNNMRTKGIDARLRRIGPVDEFLIEVYAIDPSVEAALRKLQARLNNRYFDDWVNMLIQCQRNRDLRFGLQPIIKAFNDSKIMQLEAESVMSQVWREYVLVVVLMFGIIPVLRLSNEVWFNILTHTVLGKTLVSAMIVAAFATAFYVLRVTRPLD